MYIYVSGPYSPTAEEVAAGEAEAAIERNLTRARTAGIALLAKGHAPFIPHTMMEGWEDRHAVARRPVIELCERWVERCDAMLFLGDSPGAEQERQVALRRGLPIYRDLDDVPEAWTAPPPAALTGEQLEICLEEYRQCAESYRHTYSTIWQAGGLIAAAGGLLAVASDPLLHTFAPLPPIAWYLTIFLPMDRYGELRRSRLAEIEELISTRAGGVEMGHFRRFKAAPQKNRGWRWLGGRWRVKQAVGFCMLALAVLQVLLLIKAVPSLIGWLRSLW